MYFKMVLACFRQKWQIFNCKSKTISLFTVLLHFFSFLSSCLCLHLSKANRIDVWLYSFDDSKTRSIGIVPIFRSAIIVMAKCRRQYRHRHPRCQFQRLQFLLLLYQGVHAQCLRLQVQSNHLSWTASATAAPAAREKFAMDVCTLVRDTGVKKRETVFASRI